MKATIPTPRQIIPDPTEGFRQAVITSHMPIGSAACEIYPPIQWDEVIRVAQMMRAGRLPIRPVKSPISDHSALAGSFLLAG